jgi:putative endonuclease
MQARRERRHVESYWVYLLHCSDGSYYAGITGNVDARIYQHNHGLDGPRSYTKRRRPVKLLFAALYFDVEQAIAFEKQVKGWSRAKKEALVRGDYSALQRLARNYASLRTGDQGRASTGSA